MTKVTYNPAQQEAIVSDKKYVRVIAGAGAGGAIGGPGGKIAGGLVGEELGDLVMK